LRESALQLFSILGYDAVTTDEIAERAGVSSRTFFRYFPTKESVLLGGQVRLYRAFSEVYAGQPMDLDEIEALCATYLKMTPDIVERRRNMVLYARAVESSPALRGHIQDYRASDLAQMAEAIARRRELDSPDDSCHLLASVGLLAFHSAWESWLAGPTSADLNQVVVDTFGRLRATVGAAGEQPGAR
jgi:AcrR family transcriptional regulator